MGGETEEEWQEGGDWMEDGLKGWKSEHKPQTLREVMAPKMAAERGSHKQCEYDPPPLFLLQT